MHHGCNPAFEFWMGQRRERWGHGPRGRRDPDFSFFANLFGGPGPRAERGDVKYLILDAVADAPRHGYEIMQVIEERSKGAYRPSAGVIYPTLQLLEETRLLRGRDDGGRRIYEITEAGRRELEANRETVREFYGQQDDAPWEVYADELREFSRRLVDLTRTVRRAARRGRLGPAAVRKLRRILDETIKQVEDVFGEERRD